MNFDNSLKSLSAVELEKVISDAVSKKIGREFTAKISRLKFVEGFSVGAEMELSLLAEVLEKGDGAEF